MIRFLRYLILVVLLFALIGYLTVYFMADRIVQRVEKVLTHHFIAPFGPAENDDYGYKSAIRFYPPVIEITDFYIKAKALKVDKDIFDDCEIKIDRIVCELLPLIRENKVIIRSIEGREFSGSLTLENLASRLERTGGAVTNLKIDEHRNKCRIRGRMGHVKLAEITVEGRWSVDDRGVITLIDRVYYNPDSYIPEGAVRILERQINFDIRIFLFDSELEGESVSFSSSGLKLKARELGDKE